MQQKNNPIVLLMAMADEAKYLIQLLGFEKLAKHDHETKNFPLEIYTAQFNQQNLILIFPGLHPIHNVDFIGTQMAAIATWEAIRRFSPQLIINAGTAGGFEKYGAQVGDLYLIQQPIYYHDRYIPLGNFEHYGYGGFHPHPVTVLSGGLIFKDGVLSSSNSFVTSAAGQDILQKFQVGLVDMEAAAIAEVATRLHVPFTVLKIISDIVDHPQNAEDFLRNLPNLARQLAEAVEELLNVITSQ